MMIASERWPGRWVLPAVVAAALLVAAGACSSDSDSSSSDDPATTSDPTVDTEATDADGGQDGAGTTLPDEADVLEILVTNDDGAEAEGIDALVTALAEQPGVEVTVVAPAENQSGTSDSTTEGAVASRETTTISGYPAVAVEGFPADSVVVALDEQGVEPDLVISGVNEGQNIGPLIEISGTVGAARTAARRGIPAVAVSAGLADPVDFETAVGLVVDWVTENRELLVTAAGTGATDVTNLNSPTCLVGEVRGLAEVPAATEPAEASEADCQSTLTDPADDIEAFVHGFAPISIIDLG